MKKSLPILMLVLIALSSCVKEVSKNVDQSKIWTSYELFYDQNTNKTQAIALFKFSSELGTTLKLSDPSEVKFDNQQIDWNPESQRYEKELDGFVTNGTFEWTDTDGNVYSNSVVINQIAYPAIADTIYKNQVNQIAWIGSALGTLEA
ncbi:hypothetical protein ACFLR1_07225, partial [Bacteroidota bacterium]